MTILWANQAGTQLAAAIATTGATTCTVVFGTGALFPSPGAGQYFTLTLTSATNPATKEITHCTNVSGDVLTIVRGQEGTTALIWNAGDLAQNLLTAASVEAFWQTATSVGGILTGTLPNPGMASGAAAANVGTLGGVLSGTLPDPGMAAGAASTNVGTLGGVLTGTLPDPGFAALTQSLAGNGYCFLPGPANSQLLLQWGYETVTTSGSGLSNFYLALPRAFPNQHLIAFAVFYGNTPPGNGTTVAGNPDGLSNVQITINQATSASGAVGYGVVFLCIGN